MSDEGRRDATDTTIRRFEDLIAWQKARLVAAAIYRVTDSGSFARDVGLKNQVRCAAVSIMSNIAEGYERGTPGEFCHFLLIAKGSCAEVRSQLYVALDVGHLTRETFAPLIKQAEELGRVIGGLRTSAERRRAGSK